MSALLVCDGRRCPGYESQVLSAGTVVGWLCYACWCRAGKPAPLPCDDAAAQAAALVTRERMLARGGTDRRLAQGRGAYGVVRFDEPSGAVTAAAGHDSGRFSVADPRFDERGAGMDSRTPGGAAASEGPNESAVLPAPDSRLVAIIRALDGTWHRPFTTLELAALQSLIDPDDLFALDGTSDTAWRERIGNAVPPDAAAAIASEMGRTLLLAWTGETFALSATPVWVQPLAIALSVQGAM